MNGRLRFEGEHAGEEHWTWSAGSAGSLVSVVTEIHGVGLRRHAAVTLDLQGSVREAFLRVEVDDDWVGSGRYRLGRGSAEAHLWSPAGERRVAAPLPDPPILVTHPVCLDGLHGLALAGRGPGRHPHEVLNTSYQPDGADPPTLRRHPSVVEIDGVEQVAVGAGEFRALRFALHPSVGGPPIQLWVEPELGVTVLVEWEGRGRYELVELSAA